MKKTQIYLALGLTSIALFTSCARNTPETYNAGQIGYAQEFRPGTLIAVKEILVDRGTLQNRTGAGTGAVVGGIVGGVIGNEQNDSSGAVLGGAAGAILGGVIGSTADKYYGKVPALELTVQDATGSQFIVIQGKDQIFEPGEAIKIITTASGQTLISK